MVNAVTGHLMSFIHDALHHLWCMFGKVSRAEKGGTDTVPLQYVENAICAYNRHFHALLQRIVYAVLTWHVKLFGVKTE